MNESQATTAYGGDNVVRQWAKAWSAGDTALFLSLFAEDASYCDVALDKVFRGREAIRTFFEGTFVTFPDFKMEMVRSAVTPEAAAGEWVMSGTFLGPSFGQSPTGKSFRVRMMASFEFQPGTAKIICERPYYDRRAVVTALGLG